MNGRLVCALGLPRARPYHAAPLQLPPAIGRCRHPLPAFLRPAPSLGHQGRADHRVLACRRPADPPAPLVIWDGLPAQRSARARILGSIERRHPELAAAVGLCTGAQSDRIHLGPSEASRTRQPLRRPLPRPQIRCPQSPALYAGVPDP